MNKTLKKVILRGDGNSEVGYGHLSRLFALSDIINLEFKIIFLTRHNSKFSLFDDKNEIVVIPKEVCFKKEVNWISKRFSSKNNLIVLDGYQFNSDYQKELKNIGFKLIFIDDLIEHHMYADFVINHAIGLKESQYNGETYVKYFLGSKYSLLRNSFIKLSKSINKKKIKFNTGFICFGGTNSSKITLNAINSLLKFKKFYQD